MTNKKIMTDVEIKRDFRKAIEGLRKGIKDPNIALYVEQIINYVGLKEAEAEQNKKDARTDHLTGLPNRREFNERLEEEIARYGRNGKTFSVLLLDIDHFKKVNDDYGHDIGDKVLEEISSVLKKIVRGYDIITKGRTERYGGTARYGGEEFVIILPGTQYKDAKIAAERIREEIENNVIQTEKGHIQVTVSGGLAIHEGGTGSDLLKTADMLLYRAKGTGRNKIGYLERAVDCENTNV